MKNHAFKGGVPITNAPEKYNKDNLIVGKEVDIYAFGMLIFIMESHYSHNLYVPGKLFIHIKTEEINQKIIEGF